MKSRQILAALLASVMMISAVPQTTLAARAAELESEEVVTDFIDEEEEEPQEDEPDEPEYPEDSIEDSIPVEDMENFDMPEETTTYYIEWDLNGGMMYAGSQCTTNNVQNSIVANGKKTLEEVYITEDIYRGGYIFKGWYTEKSGGDKIESDTVLQPIGSDETDVTYYAHYEPIEEIKISARHNFEGDFTYTLNKENYSLGDDIVITIEAGENGIIEDLDELGIYYSNTYASAEKLYPLPKEKKGLKFVISTDGLIETDTIEFSISGISKAGSVILPKSNSFFFTDKNGNPLPAGKNKGLKNSSFEFKVEASEGYSKTEDFSVKCADESTVTYNESSDLYSVVLDSEKTIVVEGVSLSTEKIEVVADADLANVKTEGKNTLIPASASEDYTFIVEPVSLSTGTPVVSYVIGDGAPVTLRKSGNVYKIPKAAIAKAEADDKITIHVNGLTKLVEVKDCSETSQKAFYTIAYTNPKSIIKKDGLDTIKADSSLRFKLNIKDKTTITENLEVTASVAGGGYTTVEAKNGEYLIAPEDTFAGDIKIKVTGLKNAKVNERNISFDILNEYEAEILVHQGDRAYILDSNNAVNKIAGDVSFKVVTDKRDSIKKVNVQDSNTGAITEIKAKGGEYVIPASFHSQNVEITLDGKWAFESNLVTVNPNVDYSTYLYRGSGYADIEDAHLYFGNKEIKYSDFEEDSFSYSGNNIYICKEILSSYSGKTLTVKAEQADVENPPVAEQKIKIGAADITELKIVGAKKNNTTGKYEIKIPPYESREYKFTASANCDLNLVIVNDEKSSSEVKAETEGNMLSILLENRDSSNRQFVLSMYYDKNNNNKQDSDEKDYIFDLVCDYSFVEGYTPTVKVIEETDTSAKLDFGNYVDSLPSDIKGSMYYYITYKAVGTPADSMVSEKSFFAEAYGESSVVQVDFAKDSSDHSKTQATKYDVVVRVAYCKNALLWGAQSDEQIANAINDGTILLGKEKKLRVATKLPAYAKKVTLKKTNNIVYTTDEAIEVASVSFDKNCTYTNATATVIPPVGYTGKAIEATIEDGKLYISGASKPCELTIDVVAEGPDYLAAHASMVVKVIENDDYVELEGPSRVYKAYNKAASYKVKADTSSIAKGRVGKIQYELNNPVTGVSVNKNNGTVSIAKDVDLQSVKNISVEATVYEKNTNKTIDSDIFVTEISTTKTDLAELRLEFVDLNHYRSVENVVYNEKEKIDLSKLSPASESGDSVVPMIIAYDSKGKVIDKDLISLTTSDKSIELSPEEEEETGKFMGYIVMGNFLKKAGKYTFIATVVDGTKTSKKVVVNTTIEKEAPSVQVNLDDETIGGGTLTTEGLEIVNSAIGIPSISLWISAASKHILPGDIKVKGGSYVTAGQVGMKSFETNKGVVVLITPTAEVTEVSVGSYKLKIKNTNFSDEKTALKNTTFTYNMHNCLVTGKKEFLPLEFKGEIGTLATEAYFTFPDLKAAYNDLGKYEIVGKQLSTEVVDGKLYLVYDGAYGYAAKPGKYKITLTPVGADGKALGAPVNATVVLKDEPVKTKTLIKTKAYLEGSSTSPISIEAEKPAAGESIEILRVYNAVDSRGIENKFEEGFTISDDTHIVLKPGKELTAENSTGVIAYVVIGPKGVSETKYTTVTIEDKREHP